MRKVFAVSIVILGLGFAPALFPLPWWSTGPEPERAFLSEIWLPTLSLVVFNIVGGLTLLWVRKWWSTIALVFCIAQLTIWWQLSGFFESGSSLLRFLPHKLEMIELSLGHTSTRVALAVFHRDVLVCAFYHIATVVLLVSVARNLWTRVVEVDRA